jgi:uncharacterized tellurite resistance protein B-like protein
MIRKILDQVAQAISSPAGEAADAPAREHALRMATVILMIDVARADYDFDEDEFDRVLRLCEAHFHLSPEEAAELVNAANERAENVVSVHEFTQLLHRSLEERDKERIVELLWKIAYADGRLDKYEDSLVLRISDLLYVNRAVVMRLKHEAGQTAV